MPFQRAGLGLSIATVTVLSVACSGSDSHPTFNPFDTMGDADCGGSCKDPGTPGDTGLRDGFQDPDLPVTLDPGPDPADPDVVVPVDAAGDAPSDPGPSCTSMASCELGYLCVDAHCVPGCQSQRDCPDGQRCDPLDGAHGACKDCLTDEDCPDLEKCRDGTCASVCTVDGDCLADSSRPRCSKTDGVCVACLAETDCRIGDLCVDSACVPGCRGDRDCAPPLVCNPDSGTNGTCVECVDSGDCAFPKTCKGGTCGIDCQAITCPPERPLCLPGTGDCVQCTGKADCGVGRVCSNQQCVSGCASDDDCSGAHCKAGGYGTCVACVLDGQCPPLYVCRNDVCTAAVPSCNGDGDCKNGQYCHPVLDECRPLPSQPCTSPGGGCGFLGLSFCDPLTRTCIDSCTLGVCGLLGSTTTPICVDGGCYQCGSSADCPGTQCSLFDRTCNACTQDGDCVGAQTRCDTSDGKCYGCLNDYQCGTGKRCEPAGRTCVECLSNLDCKLGAKPTCGKDGTCIANCTDECAKTGDVYCVPGNPDAYRECGDWDNDPCLEIGSEYGSGGYACPPVQQCDVLPDGIHGQCVCHDECTSGQSRCNANGYQETCDQNYNSGCWYWGVHSCPSNQYCSGGKCY